MYTGPETQPGKDGTGIADIFTKRPPKDKNGHYILSDSDKKMISWALDEDEREYNDYGKYVNDFSPETLEAVHLAANSGDKDLFNLALGIVCEGYKQLAYRMISSKYHTTDYDDQDDMMQEFRIALWNNLSAYDPKERGCNILSVCKGEITQRLIKQSIDQSGMGIKKQRSYINANNEIQNALSALRARGIDKPTIPQITNMVNASRSIPMSEYTVEKTLRMFSISKADFETTIILKESDRRGDNPETALLDREENARLRKFYERQSKKRRDLMDALFAAYEEDDQQRSMEAYEAEMHEKTFKKKIGWEGQVPYAKIVRLFLKDHPSESESLVNKELRALLGDLGHALSSDDNNPSSENISYTGIVFDYELFMKQQEDVAASILSNPDSFFGDEETDAYSSPSDKKHEHIGDVIFS